MTNSVFIGVLGNASGGPDWAANGPKMQGLSRALFHAVAADDDELVELQDAIPALRAGTIRHMYFIYMARHSGTTSFDRQMFERMQTAVKEAKTELGGGGAAYLALAWCLHNDFAKCTVFELRIPEPDESLYELYDSSYGPQGLPSKSRSAIDTRNFAPLLWPWVGSWFKMEGDEGMDPDPATVDSDPLAYRIPFEDLGEGAELEGIEDQPPEITNSRKFRDCLVIAARANQAVLDRYQGHAQQFGGRFLTNHGIVVPNGADIKDLKIVAVYDLTQRGAKDKKKHVFDVLMEAITSRSLRDSLEFVDGDLATGEDGGKWSPQQSHQGPTGKHIVYDMDKTVLHVFIVPPEGLDHKQMSSDTKSAAYMALDYLITHNRVGQVAEFVRLDQGNVADTLELHKGQLPVPQLQFYRPDRSVNPLALEALKKHIVPEQTLETLVLETQEITLVALADKFDGCFGGKMSTKAKSKGFGCGYCGATKGFGCGYCRSRHKSSRDVGDDLKLWKDDFGGQVEATAGEEEDMDLDQLVTRYQDQFGARPAVSPVARFITSFPLEGVKYISGQSRLLYDVYQHLPKEVQRMHSLILNWYERDDRGHLISKRPSTVALALCCLAGDSNYDPALAVHAYSIWDEAKTMRTGKVPDDVITNKDIIGYVFMTYALRSKMSMAFVRIYPDSEEPRDDQKRLTRRESLQMPDGSSYPVYKYYGSDFTETTSAAQLAANEQTASFLAAKIVAISQRFGDIVQSYQGRASTVFRDSPGIDDLDADAGDYADQEFEDL
jgi:hypothetical protein